MNPSAGVKVQLCLLCQFMTDEAHASRGSIIYAVHMYLLFYCVQEITDNYHQLCCNCHAIIICTNKNGNVKYPQIMNPWTCLWGGTCCFSLWHIPPIPILISCHAHLSFYVNLKYHSDRTLAITSCLALLSVFDIKPNLAESIQNTATSQNELRMAVDTACAVCMRGLKCA